jgi:hypothetical protein
VRVKPVARHFGNCGVVEYVIADDYSADDLAWLKERCGMRPQDVQRPPHSGDWHGFLPHEIAEGQRRVIVNLDTFEYIDPVAFGQVPTLAGIVTPVPKDRDLPILRQADPNWAPIVDVAGGLFVMLCHPERRGGGDIPANAAEMGKIDQERAKFARLFNGCEDVKGRWPGGHILGTGEIRYEGWPTTEEVLEHGTDISAKVLRYLVAISHFEQFEVRPLNFGKRQHLALDYLKINPKHKVPTLIIDGEVLTENVAIQTWIARQFPAAKLIPADPCRNCRRSRSWLGARRASIRFSRVSIRRRASAIFQGLRSQCGGWRCSNYSRIIRLQKINCPVANGSSTTSPRSTLTSFGVSVVVRNLISTLRNSKIA